MSEMDVRRIDDAVSVSPQIEPGDIAEIARLGFRSVVCNRPDGEAAGQPPFDEVAEAAMAAGLDVRFVPVVSGQMTEADVDAFAAALNDMPAPMLAYCRSGTRSTILWSLVRAADLPVEDVVAAAQRAGYDLAGVRPLLEARHTSARG